MDDSHPTRDDVMQGVGRNLLLFQQVEELLKFLLANAQVHGYAAQLADMRQTQRRSTHGQTLGQLIGRFTDEIQSPPRKPVTPKDPQGVWISFSFELESSPQFRAQLERELTTLLAERNELVHHFLALSDLGSLQGRLAAIAYLDRQREVVAPVQSRLAAITRDLELMARAHAEFIASPEGRAFVERAGLQQSPLVRMLCDIAIQEGGAAGWTSVGTAGRLLRQRAPEEVKLLVERYGHRSIKGLMLAAECFDLREEPTIKGGSRLEYRIKPDLWATQAPPDLLSECFGSA